MLDRIQTQPLQRQFDERRARRGKRRHRSGKHPRLTLEHSYGRNIDLAPRLILGVQSYHQRQYLIAGWGDIEAAVVAQLSVNPNLDAQAVERSGNAHVGLGGDHERARGRRSLTLASHEHYQAHEHPKHRHVKPLFPHPAPACNRGFVYRLPKQRRPASSPDVVSRR